MTEYLKQAPWHSKAVSADVKATVSEMLSRIDADPEGEIRRYSRELDGWDPESFLVDAATIERAAEQLDAPLREHIAFAQDQVRTFAQAQRDDAARPRGRDAARRRPRPPPHPGADRRLLRARAGATRCSRRRS